VADLTRIFGDRLEAVVAYAPVTPGWSRSLVLVASITMDDLAALAAAAPAWHDAGIATPLVLPRREFARSLDAFPVEYGEIIDTHTLVYGVDPFAGVRIAPEDFRRAIEAQAASHLIHLRENFMESRGRPAAVEAVVRESASGFASLLRRMARLEHAPADTPGDLARWATDRVRLDARTVGDVLALATDPEPAVDASRLFPSYLAALETLIGFIDRWPAS
jgi:hypothetical protein